MSIVATDHYLYEAELITAGDLSKGFSASRITGL
jgi:hypothetical protein